MERRNALKTISLGLGYTMTIGGFSTFIAGCKQEGSMTTAEAWAPAFLDKTQVMLVEQICDGILPTSASSPGFKSLNLIQVIDNALNKVYKEEDQKNFQAGLIELSAKLTNQYATKEGIEKDMLDKFLADHYGKDGKLADESVQALLSKSKEELEGQNLADYHYYNTLKSIKSLAISTFYGCEVIATEHLNYDPIPGSYQGCIPLNDVGNTWSL